MKTRQVLGWGMALLLSGCASQPKPTVKIPDMTPIPVEYAGPGMDQGMLQQNAQVYQQKGMTPEEAQIQAQADYLKTHHGQAEGGPPLFGPNGSITPAVPPSTP